MVTNKVALGQTPFLTEIHHGAITAHRAKAGYNYPTIRLPFSFSRLIGLPTSIYQTVHDGALAFLVVLPRFSENASTTRCDPRLHTAEVAGSNPAEPIGFRFCGSYYLRSR